MWYIGELSVQIKNGSQSHSVALIMVTGKGPNQLGCDDSGESDQRVCVVPSGVRPTGCGPIYT